MYSTTLHISEAARQLGVTPKHLRLLEREGRIPPARRDFNGRIYTEFDFALLRSIGVVPDRHVFSLSKRSWRGRDER